MNAKAVGGAAPAGFELVERRENRHMVTVKARMPEPPEAYMTVHFDKGDMSVMYPVEVKMPAGATAFTLDSDMLCSCAFPPTIPGSMVDNVADELGRFHGVIAAARKFIEGQRSSGGS